MANSAQFDGGTILHHVTNWRDDVWIPLNLFGVDLSITKHVLMLWIVAAITIALTLYATRAYRKNINAKPKGIAHLYEILLEFVKTDIVLPNIGNKGYRTWTPLIATFFIFILISNYIGLIPFFEKIQTILPVYDGTSNKFAPVSGSSTITGNFTVTTALSIITFFSIIIAGTMKHGFIGHWKNMIPSGVPAPVLIILIPIEIAGMFIKPLALILRLGANMTAGHIGMVAIFGIPMIIYQSGASIGLGLSVGVVSVILNTAIYFLEFIVCLVQAYVFSLLSAVFIGMAIHADH